MKREEEVHEIVLDGGLVGDAILEREGVVLENLIGDRVPHCFVVELLAVVLYVAQAEELGEADDVNDCINVVDISGEKDEIKLSVSTALADCI